MAKGIPGGPIVEHESSGGYRRFGEYPELSILGKASGNRTVNVIKNAILQTLVTNPARIDAAWTIGSETRVIAEAFTEAGGPQSLITGSMSGATRSATGRTIRTASGPSPFAGGRTLAIIGTDGNRGDRLWRAMPARFQTMLEPSRSIGRNSLTKFNLIVSKSETIPPGQMVEVDG